jgi:hypothetical protein
MISWGFGDERGAQLGQSAKTRGHVTAASARDERRRERARCGVGRNKSTARPDFVVGDAHAAWRTEWASSDRVRGWCRGARRRRFWPKVTPAQPPHAPAAAAAAQPARPPRAPPRLALSPLAPRLFFSNNYNRIWIPTHALAPPKEKKNTCAPLFLSLCVARSSAETQPGAPLSKKFSASIFTPVSPAKGKRRFKDLCVCAKQVKEMTVV